MPLRPKQLRLWRASKAALIGIAWLGFLVAIWQISVGSLPTKSALYPTPFDVIAVLSEDIRSGLLWQDLVWSLSRATIGYIVGSFLGLLLGIATAQFRQLRNTLGLLIELLRPIPPIALVPLFILWFGLGEIPKYALVAIGVLPPVWISTHLGLQGVKRTYVWTAQSLGASRTRLLAEIMLPAAAPIIVAGLRTALGVAFYCLIAAEMAGALYGLAYRIEISNEYIRIDRMLAYLAALGVLFVVTQWGFSTILRLTAPWILEHDSNDV